MTGNPAAPAATSVSPPAEQPYQELGLTDDEYARIIATLGRRPSDAELAMYSVMWSEHCSYKSSKVHLRQFRDTPLTDRLLVGMGENAGVVDVGEGLAVTFKIESHNHPSFVEPYQGAATGVGGIVRDILTMGARPIGVLDPLRFGEADAADTARVLPGVVAGIGGYGNCLGLPTIGGEVVFDPTYAGNPLVNALCVGVMPVDRVQTSAATGVGNAVVLLGAKTGRDGIGGVSILASATFDEGGGPARRPSVQVGDPFTEKILIETCLELFDRKLVTGIQDLGGAGLTCALTETTAAGIATGQPGGMEVDLDLVPLREASMAAHEVLASESQERMLAIVTPEALPEVLALAERWGVLATRIGTVTNSGRLTVRWHGEVVVDVPPGSLADDGPVYERPLRRPVDFDLVRADAPTPARLARPRTGPELRETLLRLVASPNLCSRAWVTDQYDRYVQAGTVLAQPEDAGVLRLSAATGLGIALATDGNGRYARLDPSAGTQLALAEACRNVAAAGSVPIAVTNCLNFGSPEDPEVMWQFAQACAGLAEGCRRLGLPVTGGNVSFYNQTGSTPIHPTPVIGVLGLFDDVTRRTPIGFAEEGDVLILLGETADEFGGSEWAWVTHRHLGGEPPAVDFAREKLLGEILVAGSRDGMLTAAHDLSDGGLAQALVESCLRGGHGARIILPAGSDPFVELFSESAGRAVVAVPRAEELRFTDMCEVRGLPWRRVGVVDGDTLDVQDAFTVGLDELRAAHEGTLPALFGRLT
ncbi:phosphoribosylformylglycinamidine synthase subunit PurL [Frankia sp. BMG5.23]|uniref:phosphoribosylformylglycinamidine synthase subunit PurL n=1 Tax=Frankia sp. BMG5.23 TaxID=683305 RepID=UPI000460E6EC|nr:phosphoribosylformylglycinamidine synthase subunit PurL [Frankia sp. BMG5.23]KDA44140.1 phosphoribosylformylglycinamidine synthase subunit II [Frankia sp. BMG5.23]